MTLHDRGQPLWAVAVLAVLILGLTVAGAGAVVARSSGSSGSSASSARTTAPAAGTPTTATPATTGARKKVVLVPGPGQAFVTGQLSRFAAEDAQLGKPLPLPFTLSATERGVGNATIENALVAGRRTTISWPTGTPLPFTGTGGLDLGPVHVEADGGVTVGLDGARQLLPGSYHAGAPVAVGTNGIATPRDSVDFQADDQTVLTARGGIVVHLGLVRVDLQGPGRVSASGQLTVQTPQGKRHVGSVTFGPGPFTVTLAPAGTGTSIDAVLQGPYTAA